MKFKPSERARLNRMSKWQYALLLLMLVTFSFYSLPTFFGEQPALGLHGAGAWSPAQQQLLASQGLEPEKIISSADKVQLVFRSQDQQQRAKPLLEPQLPKDSSITL